MEGAKIRLAGWQGGPALWRFAMWPMDATFLSLSELQLSHCSADISWHLGPLLSAGDGACFQARQIRDSLDRTVWKSRPLLAGGGPND